MSSARRAAALTGACLLAGCIPQPTVLPPGVRSPYTGYSSALYGDDAMWLCRPDLPGNPCAADLSATEIHPDGTRTVVPFAPAPDPGVDCFYVYPTVDQDPRPGNHTDFVDRAVMRRVTLVQAGRFQQVCRLYVPLYRQITAGTYAAPAWNLDQRLAVAESDVVDAFAHYLGQHNGGRKVVLLGHSQGAYMAIQILRRFFDRDPILRPRLLAGMPIGGRVEVPPGERVGATFANLPLCSSAEETGCIVAFRAYRDGVDVAGDAHGPPRGLETGCVNPAAGPGERNPLAGAYFPAVPAHGPLRATEGVHTPFVLLRGYYSARCVPGAGGYTHLAISETNAPGDARRAPVDLRAPLFETTTLGLHTIEMFLTQGDLVALVAAKAAASRSAPTPPGQGTPLPEQRNVVPERSDPPPGESKM